MKYKNSNPMLKLLEQKSGTIAPLYHQQWQTFLKAQRKGLITDNLPAEITEKGIIYIENKRVN